MDLNADANLMHHLFLWIQNWRKTDFKEAFKDSDLGWDYQWNKFQLEMEHQKNGSSCALLNTILNMDNKHQTMLFNFITTKYSKNIKQRAINIKIFEDDSFWEECGLSST